jgi:hypothetical protein
MPRVVQRSALQAVKSGPSRRGVALPQFVPFRLTGLRLRLARRRPSWRRPCPPGGFAYGVFSGLVLAPSPPPCLPFHAKSLLIRATGMTRLPLRAKDFAAGVGTRRLRG